MWVRTQHFPISVPSQSQTCPHRGPSQFRTGLGPIGDLFGTRMGPVWFFLLITPHKVRTHFDRHPLKELQDLETFFAIYFCVNYAQTLTFFPLTTSSQSSKRSFKVSKIDSQSNTLLFLRIQAIFIIPKRHNGYLGNHFRQIRFNQGARSTCDTPLQVAKVRLKSHSSRTRHKQVFDQTPFLGLFQTNVALKSNSSRTRVQAGQTCRGPTYRGPTYLARPDQRRFLEFVPINSNRDSLDTNKKLT